MMGISGCGKSLAVKAIAQCFQLPLYRIDMIEVFSGRHGNPEATFVSACRTMEEMAPAVMWFDEIEMGVNAQANDAAGSTGRIFAFFLTWMQEKTRGLFVAATANRIDLLPAEMIRKGRFDEVFFVDLPDAATRADIFRLHLARRDLRADDYDLAALAAATDGYSGAEIEQIVVASLYAAVGKPAPTQEQMLAETRNTRPLAVLMAERVAALREWARGRTVAAD